MSKLKFFKTALFVIIMVVILFPTSEVAAQTLPEGMISYWKFDETEGTIAVDSAGRIDGELINGPAWTTGKVGGALSFDGINDYVDVGTTFGQTFIDFTVEAWVKFNSISPNGTEIIAQWHNSPSESLAFFAYPNLLGFASRAFYGGDYGEYSQVTAIAFNPIDTSKWHHYAAVFRGNIDVTCYVDGNQIGSLSNTNDQIQEGSNTEDHTIAIGASISPRDGGQYLAFLDGTIDELALYNRALTPEEIQQHYNNGLQGVGYIFTDSDNDGVADSTDLCPNTSFGDAVDSSGCSILQLCIDPAPKNHGQYVSCVAHEAKLFIEAGLITEEEKDDIVSEAAKSDVGKKKKGDIL